MWCDNAGTRLNILLSIAVAQHGCDDYIVALLLVAINLQAWTVDEDEEDDDGEDDKAFFAMKDGDDAEVNTVFVRPHNLDDLDDGFAHDSWSDSQWLHWPDTLLWHPHCDQRG